MTENNSLFCVRLDAIKRLCSLLCKVKQILTCCFNETNALLDEDGDRPLRSDDGGQWHTKVVALDGLRDGMPGFGSWFLEVNCKERADYSEDSETKFNII